MNSFIISRASEDDAARVIALRQESEEWLSSKGVTQWTNSERGERNIREHIAAGWTYVVRDSKDKVVGSVTLGDGDADFWTAEELADPALYLYKFMISRECRGVGLGDALLDWACEVGSHQEAAELRLDCWRTNAALHSYYLSRGFRHIDTRVAKGRMSGALFSRRTTLRLARAGRVHLAQAT